MNKSASAFVRVVRLCGMLALGCSQSPTAVPDHAMSDGGKEDRLSSNVPDASRPDLSGDAASDAETSPQSCPVVDRDACRLAEASDVVWVAKADPTGAIHMPNGAGVWPDGRVLVLYENSYEGRFYERWGTFDPSAFRSDFVKYEAPRAYSYGYSARGVQTDAGYRRYVFALDGTSYAQELSPERQWLASEQVPTFGLAAPPFHWPQSVFIRGEVMLAGVESQTRGLWTTDEGEGLSFEEIAGTRELGRGLLVHLGKTAQEKLVLTYQTADVNWHFTSFVTVKSERGWSEPISIADDNVHDAYVVSRPDVGADLYYLRPVGADFAVYRRHLTEAGSLGVEQRVTSSTIGSCEKPQPIRLPDGRLMMVFARRVTYDPPVYDVGSVLLDHDAPATL